MNNTTKIIVSILNLIICALIGYFGTKMVVNIVDRQKGSGVSAIGTGPSSSSGMIPSSSGSARKASPAKVQPAETPSVSQPAAPAAPTTATNQVISGSPQLTADNQLTGSVVNLKVTGVSKPLYNASNNSYSFTVSAAGVGLKYCLADDKKKEIKTQDNGSFVVSPSSSGVYNVCVKDARGNASEYVSVSGCTYRVKAITSEELQRILNSKDTNKAIEADFKNRVASNCQYVFVGRDEEEGDAPRSYNEIIQRVSMGTWSSVQVQSVSLNGSGKLGKAIIKVNY